MAHNFNTIEGTEVFNVNDAVQGSHALTLDDVKNFVGSSGADKFHSNIVGTAPYDALLPLTGWVAPSSPIVGNTVEVKFTDGTVVDYTWNGTVWGLDFVDDTATAQRPWIKVGNTTETSATDVLKTDEIYHTGNVRIGGGSTPLAMLHVGDRNVTNSSKAKVLISSNVSTVGIAEHGFSDSSLLLNGQSYNSFDARAVIQNSITGSSDSHYAAFQNGIDVNSGVVVDNYYGYFDAKIGDGNIVNYYGFYSRAPQVATNYTGIYINGIQLNPLTQTSIGANILSIRGVDATGIDVNGVNGSNTTKGINVYGLLGNNVRPIYTKNELTRYAPNEFNYFGNGSTDALLLSRGGVGAGEYIGIVWEAGSGATKYYSARFGSTYEAGLKGEFIFQTNNTGSSGLTALVETARIKSDGSFVHNGYHQYTSAFPTSGAGVPNGSQFKGTDGALYYKGDGGTVTLVAPN